MGSDERNVALGDVAHTKLVERSGEEGGEGGAEDHGAVAARHAHSHAHEVLLRDEAFDVTLWRSMISPEFCQSTVWCEWSFPI